MIRPGSLPARLLALALLAAVLAGLAVGLGLPLAERWAELDNRRAEARDLAQRFAAIAATREARAAELAAVERGIAGAGLHLEAESRALAGARLGETLRAIAERHGAVIRSLRVVEGGTAGGGGQAPEEAGEPVGVNVALRGHWGALFPVLHSIEAGRPYLFVRALTVSARERRRGTRVEPNPEIEMQVELYGHLPPEAAR